MVISVCLALLLTAQGYVSNVQLILIVSLTSIVLLIHVHRSLPDFAELIPTVRRLSILVLFLLVTRLELVRLNLYRRDNAMT